MEKVKYKNHIVKSPLPIFYIALPKFYMDLRTAKVWNDMINIAK